MSSPPEQAMETASPPVFVSKKKPKQADAESQVYNFILSSNLTICKSQQSTASSPFFYGNFGALALRNFPTVKSPADTSMILQATVNLMHHPCDLQEPVSLRLAEIY